MKYLIAFFTSLLLSSVVLANINLEANTGNIVKETEFGGGVPSRIEVVGNILDIYSNAEAQRTLSEKVYDCSAAATQAGLAAKPFASGEGFYVGAGVGLGGSCGSGSVSFGLITDYDISFSADLNFTDSPFGGVSQSAGFGVHYKF